MRGPNHCSLSSRARKNPWVVRCLLSSLSRIVPIFLAGVQRRVLIVECRRRLQRHELSKLLPGKLIVLEPHKHEHEYYLDSKSPSVLDGFNYCPTASVT